MISIKKIFANKTFLILFIIFCIGLIVGLSFFTPDIIGQYIKMFGVKLSSDLVIEPLVKTGYLQTDDRWKDEYLANTDYTLGSQGCLTCVIATDLCYLGYDIIPSEVNNDFIQSEVYTQNGELIWYKINSAYNDIDYKYQKVFNSKTISNDLQKGLLPIVKVKYKKTGIFHWVLIVGANKGDLLVLDPLEESGKILPLNVHGKVYAYRLLKKID